VFRNDKVYTYKIKGQKESYQLAENGLQAEFYESVLFPRVAFFKLKNDSLYYLAGVREGDNILTVNGKQVYSVQDFEDLTRGESQIDLLIYSDGNYKKISLELPQKKQIFANDVVSGLPGSKAGIQPGDIILSVNGEKFTDVVKLISFTKQFKGKALTYLINRDGEEITFGITTNENGQIGVLLSELMTYGGEGGISLYNADVYSSVAEVKDEKYPFYISAYKSFGEMWKLSKVTATMFVGVIGNILSSGEVPDSVAGPVGIASMTHVVVQEGIVSLLRFVALLSLSLGVINILPFPALDGGRLLFLVVEFIIGRKVNQKLESSIHMISYILILLLILMVTYSDVLKLFSN
ncbi:MAG: RIP metalloprotease RseP, partial [Candidatus Gracilibacteria bacterium]|nr:RIP metalloprotease RseP [Candidatus Gracilibacteria bacterium]